MSYDEQLAERVRRSLPADAEERHMFGGVAFMISGNLCVGVMQEGLLVRVGREAAPALSRLPHARSMTMGKHTMNGWVFVDPTGLAADADLATWIKRGLDFVATLPPKR
jgi:TfoX/Sxy family transcriptional regulator of competence genes